MHHYLLWCGPSQWRNLAWFVVIAPLILAQSVHGVAAVAAVAAFAVQSMMEGWRKVVDAIEADEVFESFGEMQVLQWRRCRMNHLLCFL